MMATWDKPEARLEVAPISIEGGHAVAGWIQGDRGGRALLRRDAQGQWLVAACGGDGLKDPKMLAMAGLSASAARSLASKVVQAESAMPARAAPCCPCSTAWSIWTRRASIPIRTSGPLSRSPPPHHPPSASPDVCLPLLLAQPLALSIALALASAAHAQGLAAPNR